MQDEEENENGGDKEIISIVLDDSDSEPNENSNHETVSKENADVQTDVKVPKILRSILQTDNTHFMSNFDPESSNRGKRKLSRKLNLDGGKRNSTHPDENAPGKGLGKDFCDCLNEECPGCHFPCPKCRSCKCGTECRINRKWMIESIEDEGGKSVIKNPILAH